MVLPAVYATLAVAIIAANRALGALQCYHCVGVVEGSRNEGILGTLLNPGEQSYEDCIAAPVLGILSLPTKTCDGDQVCAAIRTQVETSTAQFGTMVSTVVARSCHTPGPTGQKAGCVRDQMQFTSLLAQFSPHSSTEDTKVQVCYCDTPYCSAGECKKNDVKLLGYCAVYWVLILAALVGLLCLILITCCCFCCCCCCCRPCKKKPSGYVVAGSGDVGPPGKDVA